MSQTDLAVAIGVDPKTIERWLAKGRVPHHRHRLSTARALDVDEAYLWPLARPQHGSEVLAIYPTRGDVPIDTWARLGRASNNIDILVYSGLFLLDTHPELPAQWIDSAAKGLEGRFLYGDPDAPEVVARGEEEGIGPDLAARIRISLRYMEPVQDTAGLEVRQHRTVLYNSIYRFDDEMLINTHVFGSPAPQNPVLHLRRIDDRGLFEHYRRSFESIWQPASI